MSNRSGSRQLVLTLRTWGGKRPRSGRKPKGARALVSHERRAGVSRSIPLHVTIRMSRDVRDLRTKDRYRAIAGALRSGGERFGLRVVHHSVQSTHIHLIAEAEDARALSRGMQGLGIRIAKRVNAAGARRGKVLADRYHVRPLRTPSEVRVGLLYVLNNARKHGAQSGVRYGASWLDPYSSARFFDGSAGGDRVALAPAAGLAATAKSRTASPPWLPPRVWLLRIGWRRHGLLPIDGIPSRSRLLEAHR